MKKPEKVLYTAHATSSGGREGTSKTDNGVLDDKLTTPYNHTFNLSVSRSWLMRRVDSGQNGVLPVRASRCCS